MRKVLLPLVVLACLASGALLLGGQGESRPSPGRTVKSFLDALVSEDFKAMAKFVVGGKTEFDYRKLQGEGQEFDRKFRSVEIHSLKHEINGDSAVVICSYQLEYENSEEGSESGTEEKISLRWVDGAWKVVPYEKRSPTGYFLEEFANHLAHPERYLEWLTLTFGVTRNLGEREKNLGKARTDFFNAIMEAEEKYGYQDSPPPSGYKSMTMVEHTTILFPVGKADELVFVFGGEGATYFTKWKKVNGEPKRVWQVTLPDSAPKRKMADPGTLGAWLNRRSGVPHKMPRDMVSTLKQVRPYAAYIEVGAIGSFVCYVVSADGSVKPEMTRPSEDSVMQDSSQVMTKGFFITPDEQMLLAAKQ